jgi:hypothetical protein
MAEAVQRYESSLRRELEPDPSQSYPETEEKRIHELQLWKRKVEYAVARNEQWTRQLDFANGVFNYIWFLLMVIALALPFPHYEKVSMEYLYSLVVFVIVMLLVKYEYMLAFQVYLLNLVTYFYSRMNGSVYHPYLVYGLFM